MNILIMSILTLVTFALAWPTEAMARPWFPGEFSANLALFNPRDPNEKVSGKIFVGAHQIRTEGSHQGQEIVLIVNSQDHKAWTLLPGEKTYYEGLGKVIMPPKPDVDRLPNDPESPCNMDKRISCEKSGLEELSGIPTEKWNIRMSYRGQNWMLTVWVDPTRHVLLKQMTQQGPTMERIWLGEEAVNGRPTEKWEIRQTYRGELHNRTQWVDKKLRITVQSKEQENTLMALTNIVEAPQPAELFKIPENYTKTKPPVNPLTPYPEGSDHEPPAPPVPGDAPNR